MIGVWRTGVCVGSCRGVGASWSMMSEWRGRLFLELKGAKSSLKYTVSKRVLSLQSLHSCN